MTADNRTAVEYWNDRYRESSRIWSGKPNVELVNQVTDLKPGSALDLGCGEGADAIWLAEKGWQVTGVDVSSVALERAAKHAEEAEVAQQIDWQRHELGKTFPHGTFDLVSAQFLHSTVVLPREAILRSAAEAVAPGGVLLIEGHLDWPDAAKHGQHADHPEIHFPTPAEVITDLELDDGRWEILVSRDHGREQVVDGKLLKRRDCTVKARRLTA
ncbi:class I SAM-dependent methyltransferase [Streptomyces sp. SID13031]|uniref:class I SAM-dependent methyltransferase n=1 Tax=Streptomyces sp. SID13031 TaxID=2706046 RepID=UPI0013C731A7|nr:class I SAM-dependent methyltransferase [Streptomyces sp. SID13031]NEA32617.1 class I SAM-dependent methyltransferase [Streptomyces sp. SID13031]